MKLDCLSYNCGHLLSTNYGEKYQCYTNEGRVPTEDAEDICGAGYHRGLSLPSGTLFLCSEARHTWMERLPVAAYHGSCRSFQTRIPFLGKASWKGDSSRPRLGLRAWNQGCLATTNGLLPEARERARGCSGAKHSVETVN